MRSVFTVGFVFLFGSMISTASHAFIIYGHKDRLAPKTEAHMAQNPSAFGFIHFVSEDEFTKNNYTEVDEAKLAKKMLSYGTDSSGTGNATGYVILDWEAGGHYKALRDYPTSDSRFKTAEARFIQLITVAKKYQPRMKIAIYGLPFKAWSQWQKDNYNPSGKLDNILSQVGFINPELYLAYAEGFILSNGTVITHDRILRYYEENLSKAREYGTKHNKPIIVYMWHRIYNPDLSGTLAQKYNKRFIYKEDYAAYIENIKTMGKADGVVLWEPASLADGVTTNQESAYGNNGIDDHLKSQMATTTKQVWDSRAGKYITQYTSAGYDTVMLSYVKAIQAKVSGPGPSPSPSPSPTRSSLPSGDLTISALSLIDSKAGEVIDINISAGENIPVSNLSGRCLNIQAISEGKGIGSIVFEIGSTTGTWIQNSSPYNLYGDKGGDGCLTGTTLTITATPYTGANGTGTAGAAYSRTFTLAEQNQAVTSFTLVNAVTGADIRTLTSGSTIYLSQLPTKNLNIRANTNPGTVGSVKLVLSGTRNRSQTENNRPYALFGGSPYNSWTPALGSYTLKATPYTSSSGGGTAGAALSINFTVK